MLFDYLIIVISLKLAEIANVEVWQKMKKSNFQISKSVKKIFLANLKQNMVFDENFKSIYLCEFRRYEHDVNT